MCCGITVSVCISCINSTLETYERNGRWRCNSQIWNKSCVVEIIYTDLEWYIKTYISTHSICNGGILAKPLIRETPCTEQSTRTLLIREANFKVNYGVALKFAIHFLLQAINHDSLIGKQILH